MLYMDPFLFPELSQNTSEKSLKKKSCMSLDNIWLHCFYVFECRPKRWQPKFGTREMWYNIKTRDTDDGISIFLIGGISPLVLPDIRCYIYDLYIMVLCQIFCDLLRNHFQSSQVRRKIWQYLQEGNFFHIDIYKQSKTITFAQDFPFSFSFHRSLFQRTGSHISSLISLSSC